MVTLQRNAKAEAPKETVDIIACARVSGKAIPSLRFHRRLPYAALSVLLLAQIACHQDLSPTADGGSGANI